MKRTQDVTCNQTVRYVTWKDIPLCCPTPDMSIWNAHPRVYLPIHESGREQCPYCGTVYLFAEPAGTDETINQPNLEIDKFRHQAIDRLRRDGI
jgi:uncharacterized Zn-finger protein